MIQELPKFLETLGFFKSRTYTELHEISSYIPTGVLKNTASWTLQSIEATMTDYGLTVSPSSFIGSTPGRARSWGVFPAGRVKLWSMETNCSGVSKYFKYQRSWHIRDTVAELIDSQPVFLLKVKPSITPSHC